jgi:hypothetical protein
LKPNNDEVSYEPFYNKIEQLLSELNNVMDNLENNMFEQNENDEIEIEDEEHIQNNRYENIKSDGSTAKGQINNKRK